MNERKKWKRIRVTDFTFTEKVQKKRVRNIKKAILSKYPTIRAYLGDRIRPQVVNYSYIAFYLYFCSRFSLDPFDLEPLNSLTENRKENLMENRILSMYCDLNMAGRERFFEMLYDIWSIDKYKRI